MDSFKDHYDRYEGKKRITVTVSFGGIQGEDIDIAADPGKPANFMDVLKEAINSKFGSKKFKIQQIRGLELDQIAKIKKVTEAFQPGIFLKEGFETLNYGDLPKVNNFVKHVQTAIDPDEDKPFLPKGKKYPYTLKGSDAEIAGEIGIPTRANLNVKDLYKVVKKLVDAWNDGNDDAGDLASGIMFTLGYEWI